MMAAANNFRWNRVMAGIYEAQVGEVEILLTHDPGAGDGYQWTAESPDQATPSFSGRTKDEVTRQVAAYFKRRGQAA
jgi:hypothetical protein